MNIVLAMGIGFLLDCFLGDPHDLPHPIRWIGRLISFLTDRLHLKYREKKKHSEKTAMCRGVFFVFVVLSVTGGTAFLLRHFFYAFSYVTGILADSILFFYCIAPCSLYRESMAVHDALPGKGAEADKGEDCLEEARRRLSMIVGRDTEALTEEGIIRAAVETVAENTSDGVTAPILYMALGGPVLCFLYKAVNTMDSMAGYHNETFEYFGKAAARTDDVWNYIPSRLTAYLMLAAAAWIRLPLYRLNRVSGKSAKVKNNMKNSIFSYYRNRDRGEKKSDILIRKSKSTNCSNNSGANNYANNSNNFDSSQQKVRKIAMPDMKQVLFIYKRDRRNHKSPNSAQTESVCAGVLGIRLAGDASYFGRVVHKPCIGDDLRPPRREDIRTANLLMYGTAILTLILAMICRIMFFRLL